MNNWIMQRARVRFALAAVAVGMLVVLAPGNSSTAQQPKGQGGYVTEASARLAKLITKANQDGFVLQDNNFSIGGGWLKQGQNNWVPLYTLTLQAGRSYRFIAAGDADARDVDLDIQDLNGRTLKADVGSDPEAVVTFTPEVTGKYLVRVRLYDSDNNVPCVCLAICMSGR